MIVTLYEREQVRTTVLPEKTSGRFSLYAAAEGSRLELAQIEGVGSSWRMRTDPAVCHVRLNGAPCTEVDLQENNFYILYYPDGQEYARVHVEPLDIRRGTFSRYVLQKPCTLTIGRDEGNSVALRSGYVSGKHAKLTWQDGRWSLEDLNSRNGTYLNGKRCAKAELRPGDTVYFAGFKLIVGNGFFALNNPGDGAAVQDKNVLHLTMPEAQPLQAIPAHSAEQELFYRAPRFRRTVQKKKLTVDQPPAPERIDKTPAALVVGPAMTMALTALVMAFVGVVNYALGTATLLNTIPTMIMSFSMLCATILWPTLTRRSDEKRKQVAEQKRRDTYRAYLDCLRDELIGIQLEQQSILEENYPGPEQWTTRIHERAPELWERMPGQQDFLSVRIGTGTRLLELELEGQPARFSVNRDLLVDDMQRLICVPHELEYVPVSLSLQDSPISGVIGSAEEIVSFMRLLALQIAALHSYTEVKLVLLSDEADVWEDAKWLPHTWQDNLRMVAWERTDRKYLSASIEKTLAERQQERGGAQGKAAPLPWYVVLAVGKGALSSFDAAQQLCADRGAAGFFLVAAAEQRRELPKECGLVVDLHEKKLLSADGSISAQSAFQCDHLSKDAYRTACREMANIRLDIKGQYELPGSVSFLEMYHLDKVEHLNAHDRWKQNNPVNTLQVPVGIGTDGELFSLDLHEKVHGPHGLVAGMTGSGKSEFVISMILSLAVNYAPDEVAFILIDYKGGGLTGAFENADTGVRLPHLAGTITNLDGAEINRSLISIESELRRRQAAFQRARQETNSGTIDIYKYQQFYRNGQVSEPMPHLFIISDEFAELKSQQPEFMDQLVSTARIGRSLGVHLILATQKPAGVVDDQIWSNSRFRVCLKVQDKSDSMDMIKRPDAAELKETGRFYLQVGFNEYFAKGQSAWSGAPYAPGGEANKKRGGVTVLDSLGRISSEAFPASPRTQTQTTQVVSIVEYLSDIAQANSLQARPLWLPPLRKQIWLRALREQYAFQRPSDGLLAVAGEYDDPAHQRQDLLTIDFSADGSVLLFGNMGSGKATFLSTVLCSLLEDYTAEELNVYLIDLGAETLRSFAQAPQVGGVLAAGEHERMENLFKMLLAEMDHRRQSFASCGGDYASYCRQADKKLPRILVVLHNYAVFSEQFEMLEDSVLRLTRDGEKYGLHFIVTAQSSNGVRYRLMQNFKQIFTLQFVDPVEYSILLGSSRGIVPGKTAGRGLVKMDEIYEYQTALPLTEGTTEELRAFCQTLSEHSASRAVPVPVLPECVDLDYVRGALTGLSHIPVGVSKRDISIVSADYDTPLISLILAQESSALPAAVRAITAAIACLEDTQVSVLDVDDLFDGVQEDGYRCVRSGFESPVMELSQEMIRRNNTYKASVREGTPPPVFQDQVYVLTGISKLLSMLSGEGKDHLETLLEKAEPHYRIRFILCDTDQGVANTALAPWFKRGVDQSTGIWIGSGIAEQSVFRLNRLTNALYAELENDFGYAISRGKPTLIKLLTQESEEGL